LFNGEAVNATKNKISGEWSSTLTYSAPSLDLPDLSSLDWKYLDDLPEIQSTYDDSAWTAASLTTTKNSYRNLSTPTSLFSSDYGYHTGVLLYRGHFVATGNESSFYIHTQGGSAFGSSVWLNSTYIGSWAGIDKDEDHNATYTLPNLVAGKSYVFTVVIENNGLGENGFAGLDQMKDPRGILNYSLDGVQTSITWKLTGNFGGEKYIDKVRGPLNEGGLYAERQGYTQPSPPSDSWASGSPLDGISQAGVAFYSTSFTLDLPKGYDVPLTFHFGNSTVNGTADYRAQLWVNGYQFGKYVNNIGPQTDFPVPQGMHFLISRFPAFIAREHC
jgi:beta-galactosidase GanA